MERFTAREENPAVGLSVGANITPPQVRPRRE